MHWVYYAGRWATKIVLLLLTRWQVTGKENIPGHGPLLIVANHLNLADPPILGASIRRKMVFMAKEELFQTRISSYFVRNYGAFPVRRGGLNRKTLKDAEQHLAQGLALVMFPEGRRSKDCQLQPAFPGTALLASRIGAPILPIGISGTEKIRGLGWCLHRPKISINIGTPFQPPANNKLDRTDLVKLTNSIMEHIAALLPQEYGGSYTGEMDKKGE